jgi:F-type H+-transporting ATPase subunit delta
VEEFARFCAANEELRQVLSNRLFPQEERAKVLEFLLEKSAFSQMVKNFLRLLLEKDRIGAVEEISAYYAKLTDELSNITRAEVIVAKPLKDESLARLQEVLKNMTSKDVRTDVREDESLIGGIMVKIGDMVLDGSVRAQLQGLKESLKRGEYR